MDISKIGAMVTKTTVNVVSSKRKGGLFFLSVSFDLSYANLITKYSFTSVLSTHSAKYGHAVRYTQ